VATKIHWNSLETIGYTGGNQDSLELARNHRVYWWQPRFTGTR